MTVDDHLLETKTCRCCFVPHCIIYLLSASPWTIHCPPNKLHADLYVMVAFVCQYIDLERLTASSWIKANPYIYIHICLLGRQATLWPTVFCIIYTQIFIVLIAVDSDSLINHDYLNEKMVVTLDISQCSCCFSSLLFSCCWLKLMQIYRSIYAKYTPMALAENASQNNVDSRT